MLLLLTEYGKDEYLCKFCTGKKYTLRNRQHFYDLYKHLEKKHKNEMNAYKTPEKNRTSNHKTPEKNESKPLKEKNAVIISNKDTQSKNK